MHPAQNLPWHGSGSVGKIHSGGVCLKPLASHKGPRVNTRSDQIGTPFETRGPLCRPHLSARIAEVQTRVSRKIGPAERAGPRRWKRANLERVSRRERGPLLTSVPNRVLSAKSSGGNYASSHQQDGTKRPSEKQETPNSARFGLFRFTSDRFIEIAKPARLCRPQGLLLTTKLLLNAGETAISTASRSWPTENGARRPARRRCQN